MNRQRLIIAVAVLVLWAAGVWLLWGQEEPDTHGNTTWPDHYDYGSPTVEWPAWAYLCEQTDAVMAFNAGPWDCRSIGFASDGTLRWRTPHEHDGCDHDLPEMNPGEEE